MARHAEYEAQRPRGNSCQLGDLFAFIVELLSRSQWPAARSKA
jgi:hypothetical protein